MPGNKKNSKQNLLIARTRGSLLHWGKIEAKPKSVSLERVEPAWKAVTLPTELLPQNCIHFSPKSPMCQRECLSVRNDPSHQALRFKSQKQLHDNSLVITSTLFRSWVYD